MLQREIAASLNVTETYFSGIVNGHYNAGKNLATRIGRLLKTDPQMWMFSNYDAGKARKKAILDYKKAKVKAGEKRKDSIKESRQ